MRNWSFSGRYAPEWGSGGIFGLKYSNGVLYFTLAFEAEAHFVDVKTGDERTYDFHLLGFPPRSGGDTYNAVEAVDELIYFGGWVHAPAEYLGGRVSFRNKYSHIHVYDTEEGSVRLLWRDSIHEDRRWVGEVSEILYDPVNDELLVAREDGHTHLGVYGIDRESGRAEALLERPSPKGTLVHDVAVFGVGSNFEGGVSEFGVLDLEEGKWDFMKPGRSVDGGPIQRPELGSMASAYNRAFAFVRGGLYAGSPFTAEDFTFYRLFDFPTFYAPFRVNALSVGGGILTAYNAYHDVSFGGKRWGRFTHTVPGPTVLVYATPPEVRVVGVLGARATSLEKIGGRLLVATNSAPNTGEATATPFDTGRRDIVLLDEASLMGRPAPAAFSLPLESLRVRDEPVFGGIPLDGYRSARAVFTVRDDTELTVYEYDLSLPPQCAEEDRFSLIRGRNVIDLRSFSGIVSFRLEKGVGGRVRIELF